VCANLGNLVMAHAESRRREFVVRAALGASRGRLLRQTMTEGVLLSGAGGMLGLCLAYAGVQALIRAYPNSMPRISDVVIDVPVLLVALGLSTGTALLFAPHQACRGRPSCRVCRRIGLQTRSPLVLRTTPPPMEGPLRSSTTTNSSWAIISRRWASRSSLAAVSNGPTSRRKARWSWSMK